VLPTVKLSAYELVAAYEALIAFKTYDAVAAFIILPDQYEADWA
jgi:hypothetical protein